MWRTGSALDWQPKRRWFGSQEGHIFYQCIYICYTVMYVFSGTNKNLPFALPPPSKLEPGISQDCSSSTW